MLQKLHFSSTIWIQKKIQVQFQEFKECMAGHPIFSNRKKCKISSVVMVKNKLKIVKQLTFLNEHNSLLRIIYPVVLLILDIRDMGGNCYMQNSRLFYVLE